MEIPFEAEVRDDGKVHVSFAGHDGSAELVMDAENTERLALALMARAREAKRDPPILFSQDSLDRVRGLGASLGASLRHRAGRRVVADGRILVQEGDILSVLPEALEDVRSRSS